MQSTYILNHVHAFATQCSPLRCQVSPVARGWIDEAESLCERRSYMRHIQSYFAERLARMFLILGSCGLRGLSQELEIVSSSFSTANHNNVSTKKKQWAERRVDKFKGQKVIQESTRTLLMPGLYCCNKLAISLLSWDKCNS